MKQPKFSGIIKPLLWAIASTFLFLSPTFAQKPAVRTITGKVKGGANQSTITGATILVKGSNVGVQTQSDGTFQINVPAGKNVLIVSAVGFDNTEVNISGKTIIAVELKESSASTLNDVVVIGYGTQKRKDVSGSISSIGAATIEKVPVTSLDQALQGRAAGVQVTNNDGAPGANISVLIRGVGSIGTNGNGPLYVVDGYPISGGINNFNPSDIASIDVLKDASATAIYGIRAANGVIMVTTKKGRKGVAQVSFDAYNAVQSKPKEYKLLNAQQWGTLANQVADADSTHNFTELPIWRTPSALHSIDWQNAIYRIGLTQNYSLGIRGGSDKVQAAGSFSYYNQKGIVLGSYFKRFTLGVNVDAQPTKWLKSSTSIKYTYQNSNNPYGTGSLIGAAQLPPTMDSGNRLTTQIKDGNGNYGFYNPLNTFTKSFSNPIYGIETNQSQNITNYLLANTSLEIGLFDGLKLKTNVGINTNSYSGSFYRPEDDRLDRQYNLGGPTQLPLYSQHVSTTFEWLWENTISYDKTFGQHTINFVGGVSAQENTWNGMGGSGVPPNSVIRDLSQVTNLVLDTHDPYNPYSGNGQVVTSLASEFARLTYKFGDKYILTGTVRRDGSSKFDTGHQYGVFPSGAIAWKAKEESFLQGVKWLSDLKFRGSYGKVGNQSPISPFLYQALYSTGGAAATSGNLGYPFGGVYQRGTAATQPASPTLGWEIDYQTDLGMDAAFLHGDLTLTVDWYNRTSSHFLLSYAASPQTGYATLTSNVGEMNNKGLEVALNYNHRISKELQFGAALTVSTLQNKLISLYSGSSGLANTGGLTLAGNGWSQFTNTKPGASVGDFYGYKSLGIFQTQAQINALNASAAAKDPTFTTYQVAGNLPGDRYFADVNGDGHVNANDQTDLGSPIPKFFGGLNLDATYKAWDVNLYFYGVYGNKILNYVQNSLQSFQSKGFVGVQNVSEDYYLNRWTPTNPSNTYSRATYNDDAIGSGVPSSAWIEDGSFLKLKNLTIGYTLPTALLSKIAITKLRVYFSTQNLFTITKYTGLDPEIGIQGGNPTQNGIDNGTYPSSRFYTMGLNVTF